MIPKRPVSVIDLFATERTRLIELLQSLSPEQLALPTSCPGWTVQDIAAHIAGDDFGNLSGGRDRYSSGRFEGANWHDLVRFINEQNEAWIVALRRLSPQILIELLVFSGERVREYFLSQDPTAQGPNVAWAGSGPMPMWLHLAREYTERWVHQMQIRLAVNAPGLYEPRLFHPVLATFVHALPVAFQEIQASPGTHILFEISGAAGGRWSLVRDGQEWMLYEDVSDSPTTTVLLDQDVAWRLWTKGLQPEIARARVSFFGDEALGQPVFRTLAMIV